MFKGVKVGDKVYSIIHGWGVVEFISQNPYSKYPIAVNFKEWECYNPDEDYCHSETYSFSGKSYLGHKYQSLFWDEVVFDIPKKPEYKFTQDEAVICSDFGEEDIFIRYFAYYEKGKPMVYINGHTSKTVGRNIDGKPYVSRFKVTKPILKDVDSGICDKVWGDG